MSLSRILVVATNVYKEVIRDRVLYLMGLYAVFMFAAAALLPSVAANAQDKIILDLGMAGIHLLGLVVTVFVGTGLINKEIEKKTVLVLISKPISRLEFIWGKHFGLSAVLAVLLACLTAIYFVVLVLNQIEFTAGSLLLAIFYTFIELMLLTAAALLFGVFTSSFARHFVDDRGLPHGAFEPRHCGLGRTDREPPVSKGDERHVLSAARSRAPQLSQ
jgi:Cu-processing system permease protein